MKSDFMNDPNRLRKFNERWFDHITIHLLEDVRKAVWLLDEYYYIPSAKVFYKNRVYTVERGNFGDKLYLLCGSRIVAKTTIKDAVKIFRDAIVQDEGKLSFDANCKNADTIGEDDISEYLMDHCPFELGDILEIRSCCDIYGIPIQKLIKLNDSSAKKVTVRVASIMFSVEANEKGDISKRWRILMRNLDEECVSEYVGTFTDDFDSLEIFSKGKPIRFEIVSYLGTLEKSSYIYAKPGVYNDAEVHDVKSLHPNMWEDFDDGDIPDVSVELGPCATDIPNITIKISKPGSEEEEE